MRVSLVPALVLTVGLLLPVGPASSAPLPPSGGRARLTIPEMHEQAQEKLEELRKALSESFGELEEARKAQDVQRLGCVNEALLAIKGLVRLAEQNWVALQEAKAGADMDTAEHEYVKLSLAVTKVRELATQLKACAGPVVSRETEGVAEVEFTSDDDLPSGFLADPFGWFRWLFRTLSDPLGSDPSPATQTGPGTKSSNTPASSSPYF